MARILVVDDSDAVRDICRKFLEASGHEVTEAEDGEEALRLYQADPPDGVLLDITMPGLSGLQVLARLREIDPNARVSMLTALNEEGRVLEAVRLGARDYVVKPFQSRRVLDAVDRLLE